MQKDCGNAKYNGLLEKKWTSVIRLQKKVCLQVYRHIIISAGMGPSVIVPWMLLLLLCVCACACVRACVRVRTHCVPTVGDGLGDEVIRDAEGGGGGRYVCACVG